MIDKLIHFKELPWENPQEGVQQKIYSDGQRRMRLLRFNDQFVEADWCTKGHLGYVLSGEMAIDFNGEMKYYRPGDGLWIEAGEASKHKVMMEKGTQVELILFEME